MPLKVMTWNVGNLFRPPLGAPDEDVHVFQHKLLVLSTIINQENPDVLALQEVGGENPLVDLQDALGGPYPHRATSLFPDQRNRRRLPVVDSIVDAAGRLDSIGEDPTERAAELVPDHAPIVATFDI